MIAFIVAMAYIATRQATEIEYKLESPCVVSYDNTAIDLRTVVDLATYVPRKKDHQFFEFKFDDGRVRSFPVTNIHISAMQGMYKTCRQMASK